MLVIGRLASRWNVPIIAHLSGDDALSDRSVFDTLGSVALTSATEMARATMAFINLYGWKQVIFHFASRKVAKALSKKEKRAFFKRLKYLPGLW